MSSHTSCDTSSRVTAAFVLSDNSCLSFSLERNFKLTVQRMQAENYKLLTAQTAKNPEGDEEEKEEITEEDKDVNKLIKD